MMFFTLFLTLIPVFIILIFIPYWTRKTESFGVSIPKQLFSTEDLRRMRKKYALQMTGLSVLVTVLFIISFLITNNEETIAIIYTAIILVYIAIGFFIYLTFHRQMKKKKAIENWKEDKTEHAVVHTNFRDQNLTVSNWLYLIPVGITGMTIGFTLFFYDNIPNEIAMHYDFSGEITRWEAKSFGNVLFFPFTQLSLIILFFVINIIIAKSKQQVSAQDPDQSMKRNVIFRRRWSMFMWVSSLLLTIMFTFLHLNLFMEINNTVFTIIPLAVSLLIIVGALILSITTGQGGSRVNIQSDRLDEQVIDRDDDHHWKLGQFYFNTNDPTLFIEKRFGIGWTINFGRPLAWLTLLGIIAIPLFVLLI